METHAPNTTLVSRQLELSFFICSLKGKQKVSDSYRELIQTRTAEHQQGAGQLLDAVGTLMNYTEHAPTFRMN